MGKQKTILSSGVNLKLSFSIKFQNISVWKSNTIAFLK